MISYVHATITYARHVRFLPLNGREVNTGFRGLGVSSAAHNSTVVTGPRSQSSPKIPKAEGSGLRVDLVATATKIFISNHDQPAHYNISTSNIWKRRFFKH